MKNSINRLPAGMRRLLLLAALFAGLLAGWAIYEQQTAAREADLAAAIRATLTPGRISLPVPDTGASAVLDRYSGSGQRRYLQGSYRDGPERGLVSLDPATVFVFPAPRPAGGAYYLAPLYVSNQGTALWVYLALFSFDERSRQSRLVDAYLLGDRVELDGIEKAGSAALVRYRTHAPDQPMSARPAASQSVLLRVDPDGRLSAQKQTN